MKVKYFILAVMSLAFILFPGKPGAGASDEEKVTLKFTVVRGTNEGDKEHADKGIEKIASSLRRKSATKFKVYKIVSKKTLKTDSGKQISYSFTTKGGSFRIEVTPRRKGEKVALEGELFEKAKPPRKEDESVIRRKVTIEKGKSIIYVSLDEAESMVFLIISVY